ncbi:RNA helicase family protein, putative [Babesia bigemina]|uniref:RNA helicase family protein, putative n=1 Tax=Babesia bigemina TaxID=5866 RepID=A0A061D6X0_BABBI|nr:RNA helicase family protein, putative [Babesia bigemina]CDR96278.1 RNA helicase family protein, putative [Babesia bigemina]|eukprot:XP_012768464.1 RNA helicase family protein, putative [Babesia bigemina]
MQQSALSHFVGYLGESFDAEIRQRLEDAVEACQASALSVPKCAQRILGEFMAPLSKSFTLVEVMDPKTALDRELQVLYSADLAASYVILFCPLKVRHELYRYLWGRGAFLDGNVNWLCCPWVLNQGAHDAEYHKLAVDLKQLSDDELIDIIRLHKNYLSTDYVKQRSRNSLKRLDRHSLLSVFQSVMLRVLWGHEAISDGPKPRPSDDIINSPDDLERMAREFAGEKARKEEIRMNTLAGWLEHYRDNTRQKTHAENLKHRKLQLRETQYHGQMRRSLEVVTNHLKRFNETFRGAPGNMPFAQAARMYTSEKMPGIGQIGDHVTVEGIRRAFNMLIDFYRGNLASVSDIYGYLPGISSLRLLKFLLSYEKHDLMALLSAVLLALPEFRPIETHQDFAQYTLLPFKTVAKLCFVAIMRINPDISKVDVGVQLDDDEIRSNSHIWDESSVSRTPYDEIGSSSCETSPSQSEQSMSYSTSAKECQREDFFDIPGNKPSTAVDDDDDDGGDDEDDDDNDDYDDSQVAMIKGHIQTNGERVDNVASMVFTTDELKPIASYIDSKKSKIVDATLGGERNKCLMLNTRRSRLVTEAILMHLSNYDAVYEILKDRDIELPPQDETDATKEAIRKYKLAVVIKRATDSELEELYGKVLESSKMHEELRIPEDIYKLSSHCLLDRLEENVNDDDVYVRLCELLQRTEEEATAGSQQPRTQTEPDWGAENEATFTECKYDSDGPGYDTEASGTTITEREHYLNLLEGEDLAPFLDTTFSSDYPNLMTDSELKRLGDQVLKRMETSENCEIIHYDTSGKGTRPFNLYSLPVHVAQTGQQHAYRSGNGRARCGFRLFASRGGINAETAIPTGVGVEHDEKGVVEPSYGVGIFPKRMPDPKALSWQFPDAMPNYKLLRNRVSQDGVEPHVNPWQQLGLNSDVASAAVGWIRKCLLDSVGRSEQPGLEIQPTEIQSMAIKHMLQDSGDVALASNAASGKTLAYLLPVIQKLKEHEKLKLRHPNAPRALILVPSRELADQTLSVIKGLGHTVKISSEGVAGGRYKGRQRDHMKRLVDIVVATPERLLKMIKHVRLHKLQFLVLDEADTLLNEGFWPDIAKVLDYIKQPYRLVQVAASDKYLLHFEKVQRALAKVPNMRGVQNSTPERNAKYLERLTGCHQLVDKAWVDRPNRGVSHEFRYLKGEDKARELVNLLKYDSARRCSKVVVFCNSIPSCRAVEYILRDAGLPATSLHGKIPLMRRRQYYEDFNNSASGILVCSDLASRGLDFNADAVIMFDFPKNSMDYLKRCGRVGRMINNDGIAPRGYAISLVKKRDRNLAMAIERSVRMPFFPISNLSRHKKDYNQRSGRLRHLTQAGGYFKLAKLIRQKEIEGTYDYANMDQYLEEFKTNVREMYDSSLKKIVLRRRRICKRRRILVRRLRLMKRYNRAIRLKQRIISTADRNRRLRRFSAHAPMKDDDRRCPPLKDLKPIRAKILALKIMEDKMTRRLLERNDRRLRKFINKTQLTARAMAKPEEDAEEAVNRQLPFTIIERAKEMLGKKVKRICSLL